MCLLNVIAEDMGCIKAIYLRMERLEKRKSEYSKGFEGV